MVSSRRISLQKSGGASRSASIGGLQDTNSYFYLESTLEPEGSLILTWPSKAGASFAIHSSPDLIDWSSTVDTGVSASAGSSTSYDLGIPQGTHHFYQIGLE